MSRQYWHSSTHKVALRIRTSTQQPPPQGELCSARPCAHYRARHCAHRKPYAPHHALLSPNKNRPLGLLYPRGFAASLNNAQSIRFAQDSSLTVARSQRAVAAHARKARARKVRTHKVRARKVRARRQRQNALLPQRDQTGGQDGQSCRAAGAADGLVTREIVELQRPLAA